MHSLRHVSFVAVAAPKMLNRNRGKCEENRVVGGDSVLVVVRDPFRRHIPDLHLSAPHFAI